MTGSDRFYGYGPVSSLCTRVITTLFVPAPSSFSALSGTVSVGAQHGYPSPPPSADSSPQMGGPSGAAGQWHSRMDTPPQSPIVGTDGGAVPVPDLMDFIAYALYRTRLPTSIIHSSLVLLTRLKKLYPLARGTSSSPHRLFLSALMLASKMSMDDTYSNRSWCIVGQQLFSLSEVNRMERELFGFLNWNCCVSWDELEDWRAAWVTGAEAESSHRRRCTSAEERKRRKSSSPQDQTSETNRHRQATTAARALLKPVSSKDASTHAQPVSPRSPSSAVSRPSKFGSESDPVNAPMHVRHQSGSSVRSISSTNSSDWADSNQGSTRLPASVCASSPSSRSSESPASLGPTTPEGADASFPARNSTYSKDWISSRRQHYEAVETF